MTWFKVDDTLAVHDKVLAAGNAAMGMWVRAGAWSAQHLTDGFIPAHAVPILGNTAQARALVRAELWVTDDGGYRFRDWHDYQPSREQVEADRKATKERVARWREGRRNSVGNAVTAPVTDSVSNGVRTPSPTRPDPSRSSGEGSQSPDRPHPSERQSDGPDIAKIANHLGADQRWAKRVADQVMGRAPDDVRDPTAYVLAAIRERPADYRPTPTPPRKEDRCEQHGRDRATCPASWHQEAS